MFVIALSLAAAAAMPATHTHHAVPDPDRPIIRVSYADLDLARPEGARQLTRRVHVAALQLCPQEVGSLAAWAQTRRCRADALASAEPQMQAAISSATTMAARSDMTLALVGDEVPRR